MLVDTLCFYADSIIGLSYGDPATRLPYLLHCYPGDVTAQGNPNINAQQMGADQYACELSARGMLAHDEVDGMMVYRGKTIDILRCPYAPYVGNIDDMLQKFGKARGLLVVGGEALGDVQPADILLIGSGGKAPVDPGVYAAWKAAWGGVAHGVFVTGRKGKLVLSTDAGQLDPKNTPHGTAIKACERELVKRASGYWLEDAHGARKVNWRIRAADLPLRAKT